jgi:hypothetical protein
MKTIKPLVLAALLFLAPSAYAVQAYVSGSSAHTLYVLGTDRAVYATGDGRTGALGVSNTASQTLVPLAVGIKDVISVAAATNKSLALKTDGSVWAWGTINGAIKSTPFKVPFTKAVIDISSTYYYAYFLVEDGTLWEWNWDSATAPNQLTQLPKISSVSSHMYHTLALASDGSVYSWGKNTYGQLGTGILTDSATPVKIMPSGSGIKAVQACYSHSMMITPTNGVKSMGFNSYGRLGDGTTINSAQPVIVANIDNVSQIACNYMASAAIKTDGTVMMWGYHDYIQGAAVYNQSKVPTAIPAAAGTAFISSAWDGMHLVNGSTRMVSGLGGNSYGKLGDGTIIERHALVASNTSLTVPAVYVKPAPVVITPVVVAPAPIVVTPPVVVVAPTPVVVTPAPVVVTPVVTCKADDDGKTNHNNGNDKCVGNADNDNSGSKKDK